MRISDWSSDVCSSDLLVVRSATYTPSGKVLVSYAIDGNQDEHQLNLAVRNDDGTNLHTFFSQKVPARVKDNGIRFMVFPDKRRVFPGDFIVECAAWLEHFKNPAHFPGYDPAPVAGGAQHWLPRP